ncbi:E3 ubiquitin-protein ligase RNF14-like [Tenrec ecaudatus]|uniref:E3 ubiquitin-protein ligase RNF14-like n=1 Tax=Tenrec ecaudatus TaxID=94439 RepID=UPI003F5A2D56
MSTQDIEAQVDKFMALSSIYNEDEFRKSESSQGGEARIYLDLPEDFKVFVNRNPADGRQKNGNEYVIQFLPPLVLTFELPPDYPSNSPPAFTLCGKWLSPIQLTALCKCLGNVWEEHRGSAILFTWIQFLKEEALSCLNIASPFELKCGFQGSMDRADPATHEGEFCLTGAAGFEADPEEPVDERAQQDVESLSLLWEVLEFDEIQQKRVFNKKVYSCTICFSTKLGSDCMYFLNCKHVYCKGCMKEYFEIQIKEGRVHCLTCPEPKCSSEAIPNQVRELVEKELFERYDHLLLQSTLDLMGDVVTCPRSFCQRPVVEDEESRLGVCGSCTYAFCTVCRHTYHGISSCKITTEKLMQIQKEYQCADTNGRLLMERKYGKRIIQMAMEEMQSRTWLERNSKRCPCCGTHIEKLDGCNKMTCTNCMQYFCWICLNPLSGENPYKHFADSTSPCYNL